MLVLIALVGLALGRPARPARWLAGARGGTTPAAIETVVIDCTPRSADGAIVTALDRDPASDAWRALRANRIAAAEAQNAAYCEYRGALDPRRSAAWNKLGAVEHALFVRNFSYVFWIDADAFFAYPERSIVAEYGAADCALSNDIGSQALGAINTGVGFLRRTPAVREMLRTTMTDGYTATIARPGKYPVTWHEQNGVRWYAQQRPTQFARAGVAGRTHALCRVHRFGTMQTFPRGAMDTTTARDAHVRHFAGALQGSPFHSKIVLAARSLQLWQRASAGWRQ